MPFQEFSEPIPWESAASNLGAGDQGDYKPAHITVKVPIISPSAVQWTGALPWMDLVEPALIWEAREPDAYVNAFFGFAYADVPDVRMTINAVAPVL